MKKYFIKTFGCQMNAKDSEKLIITPHLAWASVEARTRCVQGVYENIKVLY